MRTRTVLGFLAAVFCMQQAPGASADPFIDDRAGVADEYFQQSFSNHNNSLDNLGSSMRADHDYSSLNGSHGRLTYAQSNQTDTWSTSESLFNNTQSQALLSGGLHNSNGSNNTASSLYGSGGYGSYGGSTSVTPDSWGTGGNFYGGGSSSVSGGW
jgi:hypothetical protein